MAKYRSWLVLFLCLTGCGMELATPEDLAEAEEGAAGSGEVAVTQQAIRNGTVVTNGKRGVVAIGRGTGSNFAQECTGVLISRKYLITAASCTNQAGTGDPTGSMNRTVRYYDPDDTVDHRRNITGENEALRVHVIETWDPLNNSNAVDYQDDIAVVWRSNGSNWTDTENRDYQRIDTFGCFSSHKSTLYAAGYPEPLNAGLRSMAITGKQEAEYWFYDLAGSRMVCSGDAGGPYVIDSVWDRESYTGFCGIHTARQRNSNQDCAVYGDRQYGARMNSKRVAWLRDRFGLACPQFGATYKCYLD